MFINRRFTTLAGTVVAGAAIGLALASAGTAAADVDPHHTRPGVDAEVHIPTTPSVDAKVDIPPTRPGVEHTQHAPTASNGGQSQHDSAATGSAGRG
jgi:hypothetical protein